MLWLAPVFIALLSNPRAVSYSMIKPNGNLSYFLCGFCASNFSDFPLAVLRSYKFNFDAKLQLNSNAQGARDSVCSSWRSIIIIIIILASNCMTSGPPPPPPPPPQSLFQSRLHGFQGISLFSPSCADSPPPLFFFSFFFYRAANDDRCALRMSPASSFKLAKCKMAITVVCLPTSISISTTSTTATTSTSSQSCQQVMPKNIKINVRAAGEWDKIN